MTLKRPKGATIPHLTDQGPEFRSLFIPLRHRREDLEAMLGHAGANAGGVEPELLGPHAPMNEVSKAVLGAVSFIRSGVAKKFKPTVEQLAYRLNDTQYLAGFVASHDKFGTEELAAIHSVASTLNATLYDGWRFRDPAQQFVVDVKTRRAEGDVLPYYFCCWSRARPPKSLDARFEIRGPYEDPQQDELCGHAVRAMVRFLQAKRGKKIATCQERARRLLGESDSAWILRRLQADMSDSDRVLADLCGTSEVVLVSDWVRFYDGKGEVIVDRT